MYLYHFRQSLSAARSRQKSCHDLCYSHYCFWSLWWWFSTCRILQITEKSQNVLHFSPHNIFPTYHTLLPQVLQEIHESLMGSIMEIGDFSTSDFVERDTSSLCGLLFGDFHFLISPHFLQHKALRFSDFLHFLFFSIISIFGVSLFSDSVFLKGWFNLISQKEHVLLSSLFLDLSLETAQVLNSKLKFKPYISAGVRAHTQVSEIFVKS